MLTSAIFLGCNHNTTQIIDRPAPSETDSKFLLSPEEHKQFIIRVEKSIDQRNRRKFVSLFSKENFFKLIFREISLKHAEKRLLESKINRKKSIANIVDMIFEGLNQGGEYSYFCTQSGKRWDSVIFRLVIPETPEIQYHEFRIIRCDDKSIAANDIFFTLTADSLTDRLRVDTIIELVNENRLNKESTVAAAAIESFQQMVSPLDNPLYRKIHELADANQPDKAWNLYNDLPESIKQKLETQFLRLGIAEAIDKTHYDLALAEIQSRFPRDTSADFRAIAYYHEIQSYSDSQTAVDRVYARIEDPYLKSLKIQSYLRCGRIEDATKLVKSLQSQFPKSTLLRIQALDISVLQKNFATSIQLLDELHHSRKISLSKLEAMARYAQLTKSSEYRAWRAKAE